MSAPSRWLGWEAQIRLSADLPDKAPTKTTETLFDVFVGARSAEIAKTEAGPDAAELTRASAMLNRAGVRIMALEGGAIIGVWSDLDGPGVRAALSTLGSDRAPVRYLDGSGIPMRYKLRRVEG
jgi:hypothetical protein